MKSGRMRAAAVVILVVSAFTSGAQERDAGGQAIPLKLGLNLGIGAASFKGHGETESITYQRLSLAPDLSLGKFGIGLDVNLNYSFTGGNQNDAFVIREADWFASGDRSLLDVYLPKIKFVRYGLKGEPLFIKLGSIDDATLGNGFIMGNYANTQFLPDRRLLGLSLDADGALFGFPFMGFESSIGNLARFDVMGFRTFIRPLVSSGLPILQDLQLGATLAMDTDPGLYVEEADTETVTLYGADVRIPLISNPVVDLAVFADIAFLEDISSGEMVGLGGRLFGFLLYGAQIRFLGDNFVPTYFDSSYDLFRYEKYLIAKGEEKIPGYTGWLASLGTALFQDALVFRVTLDGPFDKPEPENRDNYLNYPHLLAIFMIKEGIIPHVSFDASYDKRLIRTFDDLVSPEEAAIRARLNYSLGQAVLSFVTAVRYEPDPQEGEDPWVVTSGIECAVQLF